MELFDVLVVGAGMGGIYAIHHLRSQGLKVIGVEAGLGFGGVWYHNRYPGARVDLDSLDYSFQFSRDLFSAWRWKERYAAQSELLEYLNFVADRLDVRRDFHFDAPMTAARWDSSRCCYAIEAGDMRFLARFVIMATGNLSSPRTPAFPGFQDFQGECYQTSRWPAEPVSFKGKQVAIIGTGSTGVQAIPIIAAEADHLHVFQRSSNYSVPARNRPLKESEFEARVADFESNRLALFASRSGVTPTLGLPKHAADYTREEQVIRMEAQWAAGGQGMAGVFADQGTSREVNQIVADFVRSKIRETVNAADVAEKLCPNYPIGSRRLCLDTGYYETFNRSNVTLVDLQEYPIDRFTRSGIQTRGNQYQFDAIVLALGFEAFTGVINRADIRNGAGLALSDYWSDGPRAYLGLMSPHFPNLFMPTAPGSPSVLANLFLMNEYHVRWIADAIAFMQVGSHATIAPTEEAQLDWATVVATASAPLLRLEVPNYMVKVKRDGTRVFMPYTGGLPAYVALADQAANEGYRGFVFDEFTAQTSSEEAAL